MAATQLSKRSWLMCVTLGALMAPACNGQPVVVQVHCMLDFEAPAPCRMSDEVADDGTHEMVFTLDGKQVRFSGKSQSGWWSGKLNGRPAMGYELNRGHAVFSTADLKTRFEWWSEGNEHGTY